MAVGEDLGGALLLRLLGGRLEGLGLLLGEGILGLGLVAGGDLELGVGVASDEADGPELPLLHDGLEDDGLVVLGAPDDGADVLALLDLVALLVLPAAGAVARGDVGGRLHLGRRPCRKGLRKLVLDLALVPAPALHRDGGVGRRPDGGGGRARR